MHATRFVLIGVAVAAGLSACGPRPGEKFLDQGHQSTLSGDWDGSIAAINQALEKAKDDTVFFYSYSNRCEAYLWKGEVEAALEDCNRSIRAKPDYYGYPYAVRGRVFAVMGQYQWALEDFNVASYLKGARFGPAQNSATVVAYGAKARVLATSTEDELRDAEKSIEFAESAVGYEDWVKTPAYKILNRDTLAAAYAEAGRFDDAVAEQNKTIAMITENGWRAVTYGGKPLLSYVTDHLRQFENRKPLRGGIY